MANNEPKKIVVAVSGAGRSLQNLHQDSLKDNCYSIAGVISSNPNCLAVTWAKNHSLPVFIEEFRASHIEQVSKALQTWLDNINPDCIALAGFIRLFPCLSAYEGKIINIHPALLPKHGGKGLYGANVHRSVIASGDSISGASIHFVSPEYDAGTLIAQISVSVPAKETAESLAAKVFKAECYLYPRVIRELLAKKLPLPNKQVLVINGDEIE